MPKTRRRHAAREQFWRDTIAAWKVSGQSTHAFLGFLFGVDGSTAGRNINPLQPLLAGIFRIPERRIELRPDEIRELFFDATERAIPRPSRRQKTALLGTDHDEAIAKKLGRTVRAVTSKRVDLRIRAFSGWSAGGRDWTAEELKLLGTDHDEAIAERIGRTKSAVRQKRLALKAPTFRDRRRWNEGRPTGRP